MSKLLIITFILMLGLGGCATAYQKEGFNGGYSDRKLGKDLFQVSFKGNTSTESGRVQNFFLRRCAELTVEQGYEYFTVVHQEAETTRKDLGTTRNHNVSPNPSGGYSYSGTTNTTTANQHKRTGVIKIFKEGTQPSEAYEAKEVLNNFKE